MDPQELHREILGRSPGYEDHAFLLVTDGSGNDATRAGIGSAWLLKSIAWVSSQGEVEMRGVCGASFGSIQRAEMTAMLEGLRALALVLKLEDVHDIDKAFGVRIDKGQPIPVQKKPTVWWVCDRENLVLQVACKQDGVTPYYARRTEPDLWYQLMWYLQLFRVTPVFQPRNSIPPQIDVDARCGLARDLFLRPELIAHQTTRTRQ